MRTKQLRSSYVLTIALTLGLAIGPTVPTQAQVTSETTTTTTVSSNHESLESLLQINFETPENEKSQPDASLAGGTRDAGQCSSPADTKPLTLLVPTNGGTVNSSATPHLFCLFSQDHGATGRVESQGSTGQWCLPNEL